MSAANSSSRTTQNAANNGVCPRCGTAGKLVKAVTVTSLVRPEGLGRLPTRDSFRFCATQDCSVVYYSPEHGELVRVTEVRVPVFQKSVAPDRPVCYCFKHSVREIEEQVRATGTSTVIEDIKSKCAQHLDACERNNPQGSCCLGNVTRVVKEAQGRPVGSDLANENKTAQSHCCSPQQPNPASERRKFSRKGLLAVGGAVGAAALSSACCWLPLLLIAFGVSAAGVSGFFEAYRPWFLGATTLLLAGGFYFVYFHKPACAPGDACAAPAPSVQRFNRSMLWLATVLVLAFTLFPNYAAKLLDGGRGDDAAVSGTTLVFNVSGMTCAACAAGLEKELAGASGVLAARVDYERKTAAVTVQSISPPQPDDIRQRIESAGFHAELMPVR